MSDTISSIMDTMSVEEKIGQLLLFGWKGETDEENTTVSAHARVLLEEFHVGGVVLLGRNVSSPERTARTMNELQERSRIPLFIIADQEGGMVARFRDPYVAFPSAMAIAATGDPTLAYRAARATAEQLRAVGVNFNFAPCVDVNNNPLNPIIGTRSYGDTPEQVVRFSAEAIRGYHDGGVLTSAKHFPGHGDTSVDSHLDLPVVDFPRDRIESMEMVPFQEAIRAGVATVMTTHIMFPAYDADVPATMSAKIMTGLLRGQLGYGGVIVTDDLEMKGVEAKWGVVKAAIEAVKAGVDCPLVCHTLSAQRDTVSALKEAVRSGEIPLERIEESVRRILALKERFGILHGVAPADPRAAHSIVSDPEKAALAREIAERAVTIVRNHDGLLPIRLAPSDTLAVVTMHHTADDLGAAFRELHSNTAVLRVTAEQARSPRSIPVPDDARFVVLATCPSEPWTEGLDVEAQAEMVRAFAAGSIPTAVVALRDPYDLQRFRDIRTYVAIYGYRGEALRACAAVILGNQKATGSLPVAMPF